MIVDEKRNGFGTQSVMYEDFDKSGIDRINFENSGKLPRNISISRTGLVIESGNFQVKNGNFKYYLKHRLIKPFFDSDLQKWFVVINKQRFEVGLLVANEYIKNPRKFKEVEYIDGNPYNYATINLKWKQVS